MTHDTDNLPAETNLMHQPRRPATDYLDNGSTATTPLSPQEDLKLSEDQDHSANNNFEENFGETIVRQCRDLGISVAQVCREADIDRITVYRWTRGQAEPRFGSYKRIRCILDSYWQRREGLRRSGFWDRRGVRKAS